MKHKCSDRPWNIASKLCKVAQQYFKLNVLKMKMAASQCSAGVMFPCLHGQFATGRLMGMSLIFGTKKKKPQHYSLSLFLFLSSYTWFVPIKWMKTGVEQQQFWLSQKTGMATSAALLDEISLLRRTY